MTAISGQAIDQAKPDSARQRFAPASLLASSDASEHSGILVVSSDFCKEVTQSLFALADKPRLGSGADDITFILERSKNEIASFPSQGSGSCQSFTTLLPVRRAKSPL